MQGLDYGIRVTANCSAGDGNWYAYIVERKITALADSMASE